MGLLILPEDFLCQILEALTPHFNIQRVGKKLYMILVEKVEEFQIFFYLMTLLRYIPSLNGVCFASCAIFSLVTRPLTDWRMLTPT